MLYGEALGATPTVMALGEVYMGIQQGVVDGQENPLPTIYSNAYYEVCDNLLMTDHVIAAVAYTIDESVWQSMPEDLQAIVKECALESCDAVSQAIKDQEAGLKDTLKEEGMNIVEVDKEAFKLMHSLSTISTRMFGAIGCPWLSPITSNCICFPVGRHCRWQAVRYVFLPGQNRAENAGFDNQRRMLFHTGKRGNDFESSDNSRQ